MTIKRHWAYFKYVVRHKYCVYKAGRENHTPLYLLIIHDWTKFLPCEWFPYTRTFYSESGQKQYIPSDKFNEALNHHYRHNKHHWMYWYNDGNYLPMPEKYFREMLADWDGANKATASLKSVCEWYLENRDLVKLHPQTRFWAERWLHIYSPHPEVEAWLKELRKESFEKWNLR
jgi:hypothetical protein